MATESLNAAGCATFRPMSKKEPIPRLRRPAKFWPGSDLSFHILQAVSVMNTGANAYNFYELVGIYHDVSLVLNEVNAHAADINDANVSSLRHGFKMLAAEVHAHYRLHLESLPFRSPVRPMTDMTVQAWYDPIKDFFGLSYKIAEELELEEIWINLWQQIQDQQHSYMHQVRETGSIQASESQNVDFVAMPPSRESAPNITSASRSNLMQTQIQQLQYGNPLTKDRFPDKSRVRFSHIIEEYDEILLRDLWAKNVRNDAHVKNTPASIADNNAGCYTPPIVFASDKLMLDASNMDKLTGVFAAGIVASGLASRSQVSSFDFVTYPFPETRALEVADSRQIQREMSEPNIFSDGARVEDVINSPPRHTWSPGQASVWARTLPIGPLSVIKAVLSSFRTRKLRPMRRARRPTALTPRYADKDQDHHHHHHHHRDVVRSRRDPKSKIVRPRQQ